MSLGGTGTGHEKQLRKLARRGSASVLGAGFSAVSGIALVLIVTNGFSATTAGILFSATSALLILEALVLLGTDTGLVRWLPLQLAAGRGQDAPRTLAVSLVPVAVMSTVSGLAVFALAPWLAGLMVSENDTAAMTTVWQVLGLALPFAALFDAVLAATRGMGSMRPTVFVENIGRSTAQALAVLAAYWVGADVLGLVLAWSLPYMPALLAAGWWLSRLLGRRRPQAGSASPQTWGAASREFWSYTTPRAIARVTQTALKRSDIVLVAVLASPEEAALYTAATRFVVLGQLLVQAVQQALAPHLSTLFATGERDAANAVFQAATTWTMIVAWPIYLVAAAFAPELMSVFGDGYSEAADIVVILSLTMLLATACGPVDSVLLMAGHSWLSLANNTVALVINIALNLVLIPDYGITGAAVSWAVAIVVRNLLPLLQVRRGLGMWPGTPASAWVSAGALACIGLPIGTAAALGAPVAALVALTVLGCSAYLAGVWFRRRHLGLDAFGALLTRGRR